MKRDFVRKAINGNKIKFLVCDNINYVKGWNSKYQLEYLDEKLNGWKRICDCKTIADGREVADRVLNDWYLEGKME